MNITIEGNEEAAVTFILEGRLDGSTSQNVEEAYLGQLASGTLRFIFDLGQLDYVSSAGLRVLLLAAKKTRAAGGKIALFGLNQSVKEVFEISGFQSIFALFSTGDEAKSFVMVP